MADHVATYKLIFEAIGADQAEAWLARQATAQKTVTQAEQENTPVLQANTAALQALTAELQKHNQVLDQRKTHLSNNAREDREAALAMREFTAAGRESFAITALLSQQVEHMPPVMTAMTGAMYSFAQAANSASTLGVSPLIIGLGLLGAAVAGLGLAMLATGVQVEEGMTKIAIATDLPKESIEGLQNDLLNLTATTNQTFEDMANGFAEVGGRLTVYAGEAELSAHATELLSSAATLAEGSGQKFASVMNLQTTVMTAFHLNISQVVADQDLLFNTMRATGMSADELATALGTLAARGGPLAQNLEQAAVAMILIKEAGAQGGMAMRAFNTIVQELDQPSAKLREELSNLGISFQSFMQMDLTERMKTLADAILTLPPAEQEAASEALGFKNQTGLLVSILEAYETKLTAATEAAKTQGDAAKAQAEVNAELGSRFDMLKGNIEKLLAGPGLGLVNWLITTGDLARTGIKGWEDLAAAIDKAMRSKGGGSNETERSMLPPGYEGYKLIGPPVPEGFGQEGADATSAAAHAAEVERNRQQNALADTNLGDYENKYGKAIGPAMKDLHTYMGELADSVPTADNELKKLLTTIGALEEKGKTEGVVGIESQVAAARSLAASLKKGDDMGPLEDLLMVMSGELPDHIKEAKKAHVPPKTTAMGFDEGVAQDIPGARDLAGTAGGEAISAVQKAAAERADSIARTGEDSASGAGMAAASAVQKAIEAARKAGVEGWEQYAAEVTPVARAALLGDQSAMQQFVQMMGELNQKTVDATAATKWGKAWEEALISMTAKARSFQDQLDAIDEETTKKSRDEGEKHTQELLAIQSRQAVQQVEISERANNEINAAHLKMTEKLADADTEYGRKNEDTTRKWAEQDEIIALQSADKIAKIKQTASDRAAEEEIKAGRTKEDINLRFARAEEDLQDKRKDDPKTYTAAKMAEAEETLKTEKLRAIQDADTAQKRAQEDATAAQARVLRDEKAAEAEKKKEQDIARAAEQKNEDVAHERKMDDIKLEEKRALDAIGVKTAQEEHLISLKHDAQALYFQDEATKEQTRHDTAMRNINEEDAAKRGKVGTAETRDVEDELDKARQKYQDIHGGNLEGFDEDAIRAELMGKMPSTGTGGGGIAVTYQGAPTMPGSGAFHQPAPYNDTGFAYGGSFVVGGTGGVDSTLVRFMATPGEKVTVGGGVGSPDGGTDMSDVTDAVRSLANRPIMVYLDGKQLEASVTRRQYQTLETRAAVSGTY